jgi:beta-1,4-mannooligosaccharide/beta-1,4-mannosyl-N-acetylglucosamine phosphorylase
MSYERQGDVNGVVFPCGWVLDQASDTIRVYYGGADSCVALATARLSEVLDYLSKCPAPPLRKRTGIVLAD